MRISGSQVDLTAHSARGTQGGEAVEALPEHRPTATMRTHNERGVDSGHPPVFEPLTETQEETLRTVRLSGVSPSHSRPVYRRCRDPRRFPHDV
jgi:hypothetical protein